MPSDPSALPVGAFTAHRSPALLIDRIRALGDDGHLGTVQTLGATTLDACQLIEAGAQAIAVLEGAHASTQGGSTGCAARSGALIALTAVHASAAAEERSST